MQISQEAGKVVCYSHLLNNFPQFVVIHSVKGFGIVNKAEIDVSLELSCLFDDPTDVDNLISGSSAFSKTSLNLYSEYIMWNAGLDEAQAEIKISGRNINNLRYADDTTLMAKSEEELRSLLMKVKQQKVV